jgi:hypothetical protein
MDYLASLTFGTTISGALTQGIAPSRYDYIFGERYLGTTSVSFRDLIPNFTTYNVWLHLSNLFIITGRNILSCVVYESIKKEIVNAGNLSILPMELILYSIIPYLSSKTIVNLLRTCKTLYRIKYDYGFWRLMSSSIEADNEGRIKKGRCLYVMSFYLNNQRRLVKNNDFEYYREDIERRIIISKKDLHRVFPAVYRLGDRIMMADSINHMVYNVIKDDIEIVRQYFSKWYERDIAPKETRANKQPRTIDSFITYLYGELYGKVTHAVSPILIAKIIREYCDRSKRRSDIYPMDSDIYTSDSDDEIESEVFED